jgi:hypothetical protein
MALWLLFLRTNRSGKCNRIRGAPVHQGTHAGAPLPKICGKTSEILRLFYGFNWQIKVFFSSRFLLRTEINFVPLSPSFIRIKGTARNETERKIIRINLSQKITQRFLYLTFDVVFCHCRL